MSAQDIQMLGVKLFPKRWKMQKSGQTDQFTQLSYKALEFKESLQDELFTLSNLKKPQR
jgi:hypothetical protein